MKVLKRVGIGLGPLVVLGLIVAALAAPNSPADRSVVSHSPVVVATTGPVPPPASLRESAPSTPATTATVVPASFKIATGGRPVSGLVMFKWRTASCNFLELAHRGGTREHVCVSAADYARASWLSFFYGTAL